VAGSSGEAPAVRRIVLLGMMAAGKTAVGRELARSLGWRHVDLDRAVEAAAGTAVARIFEEEGEAAFRDRETEATRDLAGSERLVLSPGGGWITTPGLLAALGPGTFTVWLRVDPEEAVRRAAASPGERPLLASGDPLAAARRLLDERTPLYARADLTVDTRDRTVTQIADSILDELRARGARIESRPG
jgi:shikimate kinase